MLFERDIRRRTGSEHDLELSGEMTETPGHPSTASRRRTSTKNDPRAVYSVVMLDGGPAIALRRGKLQLQSEGAEIYYRRIDLL